MVECLPSKHEALSLIPTTPKKTKPHVSSVYYVLSTELDPEETKIKMTHSKTLVLQSKTRSCSM
jgi:hypothetical protein